MLRIGLTGGIGAGKSTVSATFAECGGIIVDGDVISREVVEPGTEGLAALVDAFGDDILLPDGALDRPALAAMAFGDDDSAPNAQRHRPPTGGSAPRRDHRGGPARMPWWSKTFRCWWNPGWRRCSRWWSSCTPTPRCGSPAGRAARMHRGGRPRPHRRPGDRGAAPCRSPTSGWTTRAPRGTGRGGPRAVVPADPAVRAQPATANADRPAPARLVPADPTWPEQAHRIVARLNTTCGHRAVRIDHIGSTAVAGMDAKDVIDVQVTVASLEVADELAEDLLRRRLPALERITADVPSRSPAAPTRVRPQRRYGVVAQAVSRLGGSRPADQRAHPGGRLAQSAVRLAVRRLAGRQPGGADRLPGGQARPPPSDDDVVRYAEAKEPWFLDAYRRAWDVGRLDRMAALACPALRRTAARRSWDRRHLASASPVDQLG